MCCTTLTSKRGITSSMRNLIGCGTGAAGWLSTGGMPGSQTARADAGQGPSTRAARANSFFTVGGRQRQRGVLTAVDRQDRSKATRTGDLRPGPRAASGGDPRASLIPGGFMSEPRTASNGHPHQPGFAFDPPVERDGTTVITASDTRTHTATRGTASEPGTRGLDARMSGNRALGAFVVSNGAVRWRPALDVTKVITTAEVVVGGVLV